VTSPAGAPRATDPAVASAHAPAGAPVATPGAGPAAEAQDPVAEISLLVDTGSAWTKASVVGRARGRWRLVAHAAQPVEWGEEALAAELAGRLAVGADSRVRHRLTEIVTSAPRISCETPRRAGRIAVSASGESAARRARRIAEAAGWIVVAAVVVDDDRSAGQRVAALRGQDIDAWLLAADDGEVPVDLALEQAGLVAAARSERGGPVVWLGPSRLAAAIGPLFEEGALLTVPERDPEDRVAADGPHPLAALLERLAGRGGTAHAPVAFRRAIVELARQSRLVIGAVDLGARTATWVRADGTHDPPTVESVLHSTGGLLSPTLGISGAPGRLARTLPISMDELAVADALQNLRARPGSLPVGMGELEVTRAAARSLLAELTDGQRVGGLDLLIGSGRTIAAGPTLAHAVELLLEGIRPGGVTQLAIDPTASLAPLGSLGDDEIAEGVGSLRDDLLVPLGTAVVSTGGRPGHVAFRARLRRAGWPDADPIDVRTGQVAVLPLPRAERADLEIEADDGIGFGSARPSRRLRAEVLGGAVGLVLDARGTPIGLPRRADDRREVLAEWHDQLLREAVSDAARGPA
jgi:hypothetical protein